MANYDEIDITDFFHSAAPRNYQASRMELGENAAQITWNHAVEDAPEYPLLDTEVKREAFKAHVRAFGAWEDEEIEAWSLAELTALFIQMISGEMRDFMGLERIDSVEDWDWERYEEIAREGTIGSRLFEGIDGRIYYHVGE